MASFERFRMHWIWALVGSSLSISLTIGALYLQYRSTMHELGGTLNATFHSHYLNNRESRTIVVCMEDTSVNLNNLYVTPTFDNSSEYSLKDFSLSFDAESSNVELIPSTFVDAHEYGNNEQIFKYRDDILAAHDDTKKPFSKFIIKNTQGRCYIKTKASYDGAKSAFEYNTDVWFFVVPKTSTMSYENWKINCKKRLFENVTDQYYDVYFFTRDHETEYQFDVALQNNNNQIEKADAKPYVANNSQSKQENKKSLNIEKTHTQQNVENIKKENKNLVEPVVVHDNDQDLNLSQYSSTFDGVCLSIDLKFNQKANEDATYLLYGHYTTAESEDLQVILCPIDVESGRDGYKFNYKTNEEYIFKDDLRIIKQSNAENFVDYSQKGESTEIRSKSNNDLALVIYTSSNSYNTHILSPNMTYFTNATNKILVFDTGVEKNKEDIPLYERINTFFSNLNFLGICLLLICIWGYMVLVVLLILFILNVVDKQSLSEAWFETTKGFSADELHDTFMTNKESFGFKIWLAFCLLSPIIAIFCTIYFIISI